MPPLLNGTDPVQTPPLLNGVDSVGIEPLLTGTDPALILDVSKERTGVSTDDKLENIHIGIDPLLTGTDPVPVGSFWTPATGNIGDTARAGPALAHSYPSQVHGNMVGVMRDTDPVPVGSLWTCPDTPFFDQPRIINQNESSKSSFKSSRSDDSLDSFVTAKSYITIDHNSSIDNDSVQSENPRSMSREGSGGSTHESTYISIDHNSSTDSDYVQSEVPHAMSREGSGISVSFVC
jgi:hypothetical protein